MATPAQITANRQNAQHSTGPRTDVGKAKVAQNRVTHGLTGRHVILPDENPAEYDRLLAELTEEHHSLAPTERFLVEQLAQAQWRLNRIARMEADIFRRGMEAEKSSCNAARSFPSTFPRCSPADFSDCMTAVREPRRGSGIGYSPV